MPEKVFLFKQKFRKDCGMRFLKMKICHVCSMMKQPQWRHVGIFHTMSIIVVRYFYLVCTYMLS